MSDVQTVLDRIDALVSRYYHHADEETRAVITNLTGIHRLMADLIVAQAREREHWATEARNAEEARDEALALAARADDENARLRAIEQEYEAHRCEGAS
ncbi:hypothetical protein [Mycolicibacterium peregrinum]|uniref:hypothetical protein n=1 Tax=Mycolicibacterium peregrinum TaxID=43304 RepID=UPI003AAC4386